MGSHRPYGRGDRRLPRDVSRRAAAAAPGRLAPSVGPSAAETIHDHYDRAVRRAGGRVRRLVDSVSGDAAIVVCGDHGEELGEDGCWFHGPYRRRVVDTLTTVPLWTRNVAVGERRVTQTQIPAALAKAAGVDGRWQAAGLGAAECGVTVAPWAGKVSLRVGRAGQTITFDDAVSAQADEMAAGADDERLQALGYV